MKTFINAVGLRISIINLIGAIKAGRYIIMGGRSSGLSGETLSRIDQSSGGEGEGIPHIARYMYVKIIRLRKTAQAKGLMWNGSDLAQPPLEWLARLHFGECCHKLCRVPELIRGWSHNRAINRKHLLSSL